MEKVSELRDKIYDHFQSSARCHKYFFDSVHRDEFAAYYTAMYLLQDSTEGLLRHREVNFSADPLIAYIELWGVLQAIIIQQDSIETLYKLFNKEDICKGPSWKTIRDFRVRCAGHPVDKGAGRSKSVEVERSFMGRNFGGYDEIKIETWNKAKRAVQHRKYNLGKMIDSYAQEAALHLSQLLQGLKKKWK